MKGQGPPEFAVPFSTVSRAFPIRSNGTFTVRQTTTYEGRVEVLVRGEFAAGRVRGTATAHQRWTRMDCRGTRSFAARRQRG